VLEPLAERDVVALLEGLGRFDDDGAAAVAWHLHRHTGGNPLFIAATLDALDHSGVLSIKDGQWRFSGPGAMEDLPRTLGALIDNRVARLASWVRSCVEILAVSGQELTVEVVARALRMSEPRVELAFGVLMEERLVRQVGAALYEMAHDELRRLVCEPISEARQANLRTCLRKALESEGVRTKDREPMTPERGQSAKAPTSNVEAYGLWLEGRACLNRLSVDALVRSVGCFERAIALDPDYALAHVGLADAYVRMAVFGPKRPHEVCPKAKAAAREALALDGVLAEAHTSLAWVSFIYDWNWEEAEQRFRRALELSPGYPVALQGYAHLLCSLGRHGEALEAVTRILDLGPFGPGFLGLVLFLARRYDEAMAALRRSLELDPGYFQARVTLPWVYTAAGRYEEAVAAARESVTVTGGHEIALSALGYACARFGLRTEALSILARLKARPENARCDFSRLAELYTALGDRDLALDHLEQAVAEREHILVQLRVVPWYDDLRGHPRFQAILKQMGLDGRSSVGGEVLPGEAGRPAFAPDPDRVARDSVRPRLRALHLPGRRRASLFLGAALAAGIVTAVATVPGGSTRLPWQPDAGGTYFNPRRGLEGTAFLSDPVYRGDPRYVVTIRGPAGWNRDSTFECYPTVAPQVPAARRAICWTLSAPPVTGEYEAVSVVGGDTLRARFHIDASSSLAAPEIQDLSLRPSGIRVRWRAAPEAKSFMVRLSGLPFGGTLTESLLPGSAREATLSLPRLEHGRDYQATVFALGADITRPGPAPDRFNVSVHAWRVRHDSIASSLDRADPGDPARR
jgi:tetratricopeptide (TPR) repeat protein